MIRTLTTAALLSLTVAVVPASADDSRAAAAAPASAVQTRISRALARPKTLPALYASYVALQAYDVFSTKQALGRGAREANPLMQGVVGHTSAFVAVKAAVAIGTIVAAESLWKNNNKAAAIVVMLASNSVATLVAARNARTLRQLR